MIGTVGNNQLLGSGVIGHAVAMIYRHAGRFADDCIIAQVNLQNRAITLFVAQGKEIPILPIRGAALLDKVTVFYLCT